MKLSIKDRIHIPSLFPKAGDMVTLRIIEDLMGKTKLSQEEMDAVGFKASAGQDGMISYNWDKEADIEVELTSAELTFLQGRIKELDTKKEIPREMFDLYQRISEVTLVEKKEEIKPKK